jgi:hypothetical protein
MTKRKDDFATSLRWLLLRIKGEVHFVSADQSEPQPQGMRSGRSLAAAARTDSSVGAAHS